MNTILQVYFYNYFNSFNATLKKLWESSKHFNKHKSHTRCLMRVYYALVPTTTTEAISTTAAWSLTVDGNDTNENDTTSDHENATTGLHSEHMGKLKVSLKTKPPKVAEAQHGRKERKPNVQITQNNLARDV
ncbi:hypothetical protein Y032_0010g987 [Ancylostoma ceylanicum]|uniref:Uncharacterized protein n=1 Tax=Ancylostoma ceylanicum TaxID=53326 RepID=A0A016VHQ2_9BILA|nr:hypothetical protein Y032_0010g987 [Ancylostoma ceylanicum]